MATVTTTATDSGTLVTFDSPAAREGNFSPNPIAKVVYDFFLTVPSKVNTDVSQAVMNMNVPLGYFYRIKDLSWSARAVNNTVFTPATGFEIVADVVMTENQVGVHNFGMWNVFNLLSADINVGALDAPATTEDFGTFFRPIWDVSAILVDASRGVAPVGSVIRMEWQDRSGDASVAVTVAIRAELDLFTIGQANKAPVNTSVLTYNRS